MHFPTPEEALKMIQQQREHAKMHFQADSHDFTNLIRDLSESGLDALSKALTLASQHEGNAAYMVGRIDAELESRYDVCPCGEKHDTDDLLGGAAEVKTEGDAEQALIDLEAESNLYLEYDVSTVADGKLRCNSCGIEYASLEDRMLKPKGRKGCHGCGEMGATGQTFGPTPDGR